MGYTDEQKHQHYQFLLKSIEELRSGHPPTDDWEQEHFNFFRSLRREFPNFHLMNNEQDGEEFIQWKNHAEQLARYQEMYWESNGEMNYPAYLQLLEYLLMLANYMKGVDDDDGLSAMMENLGMK